MKYIFQLIFTCLFVNILFGQSNEKSHIFNSSAVVNSKPILLNDISFNSGELLTANFQYANKDNIQKVVIKPFGFSGGEPSFWKDTKLNLTQKGGITTIGVGFTYDNSAGYNTKRIDTILAKASIPGFQCNIGESQANCKLRKISFIKNHLNPTIVTDILQKRVKNSFSLTWGYNISLFEIIGGDKVLNDDSLIGNQFNIKAHSLSVDLSYAFSEKTAFSLGVAYQKKRKSSVEDQKMIKYYGLNFTLSSWLTALDNSYKSSTEYNKNLFASSVYWGLSFEYLKARGDSKFFEDGIKYQYIITPFVDFRISPKSQFRLGLPIKKSATVNKNQVGLGPFLQYALQLEDKS